MPRWAAQTFRPVGSPTTAASSRPRCGSSSCDALAAPFLLPDEGEDGGAFGAYFPEASIWAASDHGR